MCYMRSIENGKDAFGKKCKSEDIIVIINPHDSVRYINLNLNRYGVTEIRDTLSGEMISPSHRLTMELAPLSYRVLTPERKTDICTKIQDTQ